jgi:hypothetical protein
MPRTASSSSTTRTVPLASPDGGVGVLGTTGTSRPDAGKMSVKVVPTPGLLSTFIAPWCPRTMPCTAASPSPRPVNFVVKNGSKILSLVAASMPDPVSTTWRNA